MRSSINNTSPEIILDDIIMTNDGDDFEAFAVDWISGNIYFATSVTQVIDVISDSTSDIFVTSKNTEYFRSIIHKNPGLIKGIVLAPMLGKMYWHDKGKYKCFIQIALDYDLRLTDCTYRKLNLFASFLDT